MRKLVLLVGGLVVVSVLCCGCNRVAMADDIAIKEIAAQDAKLIIRTNCPPQLSVALIDVPPYTCYTPGADLPVVFQGSVKDGQIIIDRFDGPVDRLYHKFQLIDSKTSQTLGHAHWVTDLSALRPRNFEIPWPDKTIKGLSCIISLEDAKYLGVSYATDNLWFDSAFDCSKGPGDIWLVDGVEIPLNPEYFQQLDETVKGLNDIGINVTLVLNNRLPEDILPGDPLLHPRTNVAGAPFHLGAINMTNKEGYLHFRAIIEYAVNRYSDPSGKHGWVSGFVVGNELQAHWEWYNMGDVPRDVFIEEYIKALRVAELAISKTHSKVRTYISMEHHWTNLTHSSTHVNDPMRSIKGKELLEVLNARSKAEGDFPWHIAFHPYPETVVRPEVWLDKLALHNFNTPMMTFKNIEVLPAFMKQTNFLYKGNPRHIVLTEQGINTVDEENGELLQAAGYAYAYYRVSHVPEIKAFMFHRHADCLDECGLKFGLITWDDPPRKKRVYEVFRLADTDQWEQAFEFAKPIIGIKDWAEILPKPVECGSK